MRHEPVYRAKSRIYQQYWIRKVNAFSVRDFLYLWLSWYNTLWTVRFRLSESKSSQQFDLRFKTAWWQTTGNRLLSYQIHNSKIKLSPHRLDHSFQSVRRFHTSCRSATCLNNQIKKANTEVILLPSFSWSTFPFFPSNSIHMQKRIGQTKVIEPKWDHQGQRHGCYQFSHGHLPHFILLFLHIVSLLYAEKLYSILSIYRIGINSIYSRELFSSRITPCQLLIFSFRLN